MTLINANDASKIKPGRWHAVIGYCQQLGGYPPNCQRIDYAIVKSVGGSTVNLDRPLHYSYNHDWWEDPNDDGSLGQARIVPWDCGGAGGMTPADPRTTLRGQWVNINWQFITVGTQKLDITYVESHIDLSFENCNISDAQLSMSKNVLLSNCTVTYAEPDKLCETLVLDECNFTGILGGATGYQYFLMRNCTTRCIQISPRQFRCVNSKLDATGDTKFSVPFSAAYNGAMWDYGFTGTNFVAAGSQRTWTWPGNGQITPLRLSASSWNGNRLIIPRSFSAFQDWLVWLYEGAIVMTGTNPVEPGNYGRVDSLYAPADFDLSPFFEIVSPGASRLRCRASQRRALNVTALDRGQSCRASAGRQTETRESRKRWYSGEFKWLKRARHQRRRSRCSIALQWRR